MSARELERRARVVYVCAWGPLEQPSWALALGFKLNRPVVSSFDEAVAVAEAGAKESGFPALVQKFLLAPATATDPAVRSILGSWRLTMPGASWVET